MNRKEFYDWLLRSDKYERYYEFANLPNLSESGKEQFVSCNLCSFVTETVPHFSEDNILNLDRQIANHIFSKHYVDAMKKVREIEVKEIEAKPGQKTLFQEEKP